MKQFAVVLCLALLSGCGDKQESTGLESDLVNNSASARGKENADLPEITFDESEHDFGRITQGERVRHEFAFTNTGKSNLLISDARGSCGCTVPEWPKQPLMPKERGVIKVEFNSEGKSGYQEKTITVVTNGEPATRIIRIKADIVVAETGK